MKRLLIYALVLGLAVAGPNPLSLCALFSSTAGDCPSVETQSQCDKMDMGEHAAPRITPRSTSCCVVSQAPLPESKNEASKTTVKLELAAALIPVINVENPENIRPLNVPQKLSPPPLRSLLCTFLI